MTLPAKPPIYTRWADIVAPIRKGETGWRPWAMQVCVNHTVKCDPDGVFGPKTFAALETWQGNHGLTVDGICGPASQRQMLDDAERIVHVDLPRLPRGVLLGFTVAEGAGVLAATNDFDPSPNDVGTDCGCMQLRVKGPPYDMGKLDQAFDPYEAMHVAGVRLLTAMDALEKAQPQLDKATELRISILSHNAPIMYEQYRKYGRLTDPNRLATWTRKPDGSHYTWGEWAIEYPSRILAYVS